jgi:transposase
MAKRLEFTLTEERRSELEQLLRQRTIAASVAQRARMVLGYADGVKVADIAEQCGCHRSRVSYWLKRWNVGQDCSCLYDEEKTGRPRTYMPSDIQRVINRVCRRPPSHLSRWSVRTLAKDLGMPSSTVGEILQDHHLHPHRLRTFTFSPDPQFEEKLLEVVGLYMNQPKNAVVLCVDEKTGIQALDRTQPLLPLSAKKPRAWTNEYVRHGTRTMLASLDIKTGHVHAHITKTRRSVDFLAFMDDVVDHHRGQRLCVVLDNLNTHKNAAAQEWLKAHPTVTFHYTPTHASWVNLVECFFSILTKQGLQQAVHVSGRELTKFLKRFLAEYNERCGPFVWTRGPEKLRKIIELTKRHQEVMSR